MQNESVDRLQMIFIIVVAIAAIAVAVIAAHIVDSSYEHVKEIKQANIEGGKDDISMDIVKNSDDAKTILAKTGAAPNELRFQDQTITRTDLRTFVDHPGYTKLKILRCDFDSKDFDVLKESKIKTISLSDVPVDKTLIDGFVSIPKLHSIEMFRCDITKNALGNLGISKVRLLKFRKCGETKDRIFTKQLVKDMARMTTLQHAELMKNSFEDHALDALAGSTCVVVNVGKTNATDADLETFRRMPKLQYVDIDECPSVSCKGLKALQQSGTIKQVKTTLPLTDCKFPPNVIGKFQQKNWQLPPEYQFEQ